MTRLFASTLAALGVAALATSLAAGHEFHQLVHPDSREVFAYQPQIVPANRTAVPAP
jgi:hypothetical protein